jgi:hypothetical protein
MTSIIKNRQSNPGRSPRRFSRDALTVLEFVGCAIAIVGGMWLGVLYLGIDVRHVAHAALSEAHLLESVPPNWRPPGPNDGVTREELVATLREELSSLRSEIAALGSHRTHSVRADSTIDTRSLAADGGGNPPNAVLENTRAYWQRISDIALNEATLQAEADASFSTENAAQVFALKARVSRVAAKSATAVKTDDVDPAAIGFAQHLSKWYDQGGALYERAVGVWEMPSQGRAQVNEEWRRAQAQHRNESQLLGEKAAAVRGTLSRQFGVEFPAFAGPKG